MSDTALDQAFVEIHGEMPEVWKGLSVKWPEFFAAYMNLVAVPCRRKALSPKERELVLIAINAAVTHLHRDGMRTHIRGALRHGATGEEIVEVLQLVSVLGIHAISLGFPALEDVAAEAGLSAQLPGEGLNSRQEDLKGHFQKVRGYWNPFWERALKLDPDLFEAYFEYSSVPWTHGVLEPRVREFIYVAIDASTTHMFDDGTRGHMANAFKHGASVEQVLEVLELCVPLGIQSVIVGLPILEEEMAAQARLGCVEAK